MANKPKLIILTGPLGSGKSTLAQRYVDTHPIAMNLDVDNLRKTLGQWREASEESAKISKDLAESVAGIHLGNGYDVVIPQIFRDIDRLIRLDNIAQIANADIYEILIYLTKEDALKWFMERGGFHPGGLLEEGGVPLIERMYDDMLMVSNRRPHTIRLVPKRNRIDETFYQLTKILAP